MDQVERRGLVGRPISGVLAASHAHQIVAGPRRQVERQRQGDVPGEGRRTADQAWSPTAGSATRAGDTVGAVVAGVNRVLDPRTVVVEARGRSTVDGRSGSVASSWASSSWSPSRTRSVLIRGTDQGLTLDQGEQGLQADEIDEQQASDEREHEPEDRTHRPPSVLVLAIVGVERNPSVGEEEVTGPSEVAERQRDQRLGELAELSIAYFQLGFCL